MVYEDFSAPPPHQLRFPPVAVAPPAECLPAFNDVHSERATTEIYYFLDAPGIAKPGNRALQRPPPVKLRQQRAPRNRKEAEPKRKTNPNAIPPPQNDTCDWLTDGAGMNGGDQKSPRRGLGKVESG